MLIENLFQDLIQYKLSAILPVVSVWYHPLSEDVQWTKFQEAHSSRCWLSKSLELLWPFWATAWLDITSPVSSCGCFRLSLPSNNKGHQQKLNAQFRCWRRYIDCSCWFKNTLTYFTWKICFYIKHDLSLPCVPFLHKKVGVVNCMVVGVAIKAVIESNELLIPNLADCGRQLLLHTRECHGLSSLHVTWDTGFGRDWYATTLGQWHIAILYLFCYLVDNLVNNVRNTLWAFEWPCEYLKDNCQWRTYTQVCQTLCGKCHNA